MNKPISERRAQYPLHERLVVYDSESMQRKLDRKAAAALNELPPQQRSTLKVNGVNILNKNSVDSDTVMHRIIQRRETHNRVERRRRDRMNNLLSQLSNSLPSLRDKNDNSQADIIQEAVDYIRLIQEENNRLRQYNHSSVEDDIASVTSGSSCNISSPPTPPPSSNPIPTPFPPPPCLLPPLIPQTMKQPSTLHPYEFIISFN